MNRILVAVLTVALSSAAFAQEKPPDPKPGDPKPGEPKPPQPESPIWQSSGVAALAQANQVNGYVVIVVDKPMLKGVENPYNGRLLAMFDSSWAGAMVKRTFGTVHGYHDALKHDDYCAKKMEEAHVSEGPAMILVDPDSGGILDVQMQDQQAIGAMILLSDWAKGGENRKAWEDAMNDKDHKENKDDPVLNLKYGTALYRCKEYADARKCLEVALKAKDERLALQAGIQIAFCDLKEKKWKEAADGAHDAFTKLRAILQANPTFNQTDQMDAASALYIMAHSYLELQQMEDSKKAAEEIQNVRRTPFGFLLFEEGEDKNYDWINGDELHKPPAEPGK